MSVDKLPTSQLTQPSAGVLGASVAGPTTTLTVNDGLEINGGSLRAKLGAGTSLVAGAITAALGDGLEFNGNNIRVRVGTGLSFVNGALTATATGGGGGGSTGFINFVDAGGKVNDASAAAANLALLNTLINNTTVDTIGVTSTYGDGQTGRAVGGPRIYFPPGIYHFSDSIQLRKAVHLMGSDGATRAAHNTVFKFPNDTVGIFIESFDTEKFNYVATHARHNGTNYALVAENAHLGNTTVPGTNSSVWQAVGYMEPEPVTWGTPNVLYQLRKPSANGTVIEGIMFQGGHTGRNNFHGLYIRCYVQLNRVGANGFGGSGIAIHGDLNPGKGGQASNCLLTGCSAEGNLRSGLHILGGDANIIQVVGGDFSNNGDWGVLDESFLGNTFTGVHTTQNGVQGHTGRTGFHSLVKRNGVVWQLRYAQESNAPSITPGTNEQVWTRYKGEININTVPEWSSGLGFRGGGAFCAPGALQWSVFTGCYSEGSQGGSLTGGRCLVLGGTHGAGVHAAYNNPGPLHIDGAHGEFIFDANAKFRYIYLSQHLRVRGDNATGMKMGAYVGSAPSFGTVYSANPYQDHSWAPGDILWNGARVQDRASEPAPLGYRSVGINDPQEFERIPFPQRIHVGTTPPPNPEFNQLWVDTN